MYNKEKDKIMDSLASNSGSRGKGKRFSKSTETI